ncbi:MAG: rhomboid family intramembrane serine protease [Prolixibacteraceae bacterium]|nr:rhomboid family intramembrane serine protease [Prolixibacteraceae bacterium]
MAFGISPKHIQKISLENYTTEQFLMIVLESARLLEWNTGAIFADGFVAYTPISLSSFGEEVKVKIGPTSATLKSECNGSQMFDWGKNKENVVRLISKINQVKQAFDAEELNRKTEELKATIQQGDQDDINLNPPTTRERITGLFSIFKPVPGYFITPLLIDLNILLFIIMTAAGVNVLLPDPDSLIRWGANFRIVTLEDQWWRLLSSCFLHIGIFHLLMNMYALLYIGVLLEPHLGKTKFLAAYLLTGIMASTTSLSWHELTISAGASGAIFGMYGVFLAMLTTNLIEKSARKSLLISIGIFVGYNLLNGMKAGIDNAAHLGGLLSGIVIGYAFVPGLKKKDDQVMDSILVAVLTVLVLLGSSLVYKNIKPYEVSRYDERMKEFAQTEMEALEIYNLPEGTPNSRLLYEIEYRGIYYWNENLKLVEEVDRLYLPEVIHQRNEKLRQYCKLRLEHCTVLFHAVKENTNNYQTQLELLNKKIEALINELKGGSAN